MPTSARKSSLSHIRRGPQKAHIPYRGDNPEVGKKTGIAVQHVERKSDGFEPFDQVIQAADGLTPPQRKARRKSLAAPRYEDDYDDEDGEQSMQIDSPVRHLVNLRTPISPPTIGRRSSIRPVARTSDVDFDQIPSPRPMSSLRKSVRNGGPGPSTLSQSRSYREPERPLSPNEDGGEYDYGGGEDDDQTVLEDHSRQRSYSPGARTTSFSQIDQDDDDDEEEDHEPTPRPTRQQKGKGKAISRNGVQDEEQEQENGRLEDVEPESESDAPQEKRPVKKSKSSGPDDKPRRSKKENRPYREGSRRSQRRPMKPLAYWRGERYVYGRPDENLGPVLVPPIREIIRIPEEPVLPLGAKRKRGASRTRSKSKSRGAEPNEDAIPPPLPVENPEEGWDDRTESKCVVVHYSTREEVERRIAWTAKMVEPKMASRNNWSFDKIFNDDDFIAAGQLVIPPKGRKPSKQAKDNTYVFYVIEGAVNFKIHNTSMVLASGAMFMVPRGNTYFIENICNRDARLFFTQARKLEMNPEEKTSKQIQAAEGSQRRFSGRSSSVLVSPSAKITRPNARAVSLAALPSSK